MNATPAHRLDPEIAAWVEHYPAPEIDYSDITAVRSLSASYMAERGGPAEVARQPGARLQRHTIAGVETLLWVPEVRNDPLPCVIAMHGGGFVVGSALGAERVAVPLAANHGVVTVSVEYRLAPEHPAPAALDDCWAVLSAVLTASAVGDVVLDPARIAVHGSSAGGALAAGLALRARDEGVDVRLQSLSCPTLARPSQTGDDVWSPTWSASANVAAWRHYLGGAWSHPPRYCVPALESDLAGVAPAFVVVAEHDVLKADALDYAQRLRQAGVNVTLDVVPGTVHGFDGLMPDSRPGRRAIDAQVRALANALAVK